MDSSEPAGFSGMRELPEATPAVVAPLLERVLRAAFETVEPSRVLLLGSAARGEASYGELGGRTELFSDIELLILTAGRPTAAARGALHSRVAAIEAEAGFTNPFFHIGYNVSPERLFWLKVPWDRTVARAELVANAVVLAGPEIDGDRYALDVRGMDLGALRELILRRLWVQLLDTPLGLLEESSEPYLEGLLKLSLARNLLDVLTVFLPHHGVLGHSYTERHRLFLDRFPDGGELGSDAPMLQAAALEGKLRLDLSRPLAFYYQGFLDQYVRLLGFVAGRPDPGYTYAEGGLDAPTALLDAVGDAPFRSGLLNRARRLRREGRIARRYLVTIGWKRTGNWLMLPRRSCMIRFLLIMHASFLDLLAGNRAPFLSDARVLLGRIHPVVRGDDPASTQVEEWRNLHARFCEYMSVWKYNDPRVLERAGVPVWRT